MHLMEQGGQGHVVSYLHSGTFSFQWWHKNNALHLKLTSEENELSL